MPFAAFDRNNSAGASLNVRQQIAVIAWAPHSAHSEGLARDLKGPCYFLNVLGFQQPILAPVRYPVQALMTWFVLIRDRPRSVIVQNPPLPAVMCVAMYCWASHTPYVIDSHTGALVGEKWGWSRPAQQWLGRRAVATLVHTPTLAKKLLNAGLVLVVGNPPPSLPDQGVEVGRSSQQQVVVLIGTFADDEPVEETFAAAAEVPEARFLFTGNSGRARLAPWRHRLPANVELLGWRPFDDYIRLLRSADVIACLTTRDMTVLQGAYEAVYLRKPLVTSGWPALRIGFPRGTIFVENHAHSIAAGVREALQRQAALCAEMTILDDEKRREWNDTIEVLRNKLDLDTSNLP